MLVKTDNGRGAFTTDDVMELADWLNILVDRDEDAETFYSDRSGARWTIIGLTTVLERDHDEKTLRVLEFADYDTASGYCYTECGPNWTHSEDWMIEWVADEEVQVEDDEGYWDTVEVSGYRGRQINFGSRANDELTEIAETQEAAIALVYAAQQAQGVLGGVWTEPDYMGDSDAILFDLAFDDDDTAYERGTVSNVRTVSSWTYRPIRER